MGTGYPIDVTYNPTSIGSHQAEISINGRFLLILNPVSTSTPLTATATRAIPAAVPLEVVSIDPDNYETEVPVDKVIRVTFNQPFTITDMGSIILNGVPIDPTWVTIDGNDLVITSAGLLRNFTYIVDLKPGSLTSLDGDPLVEEFTSVFYTEADRPIIISDHDTLYFESEVGIPALSIATLIGEEIVPAAITNVDAVLSGDNPEQFSNQTISIQYAKDLILDGMPIDVFYTPTENGEHKALLTVTFTIAGQPAPFIVQIVLIGKSAVVTGIEEGSITKQVIKEEVYTLSGLQIKEATASGIYIKKSYYDDGTSSSDKFIVR